MHMIDCRNVNDAYEKLMMLVRDQGALYPSRNGKVRAMPFPVFITFNCPTERVLFNPLRNANPFFHLMEALWMIAGRDDIAFIEQFNSNISIYSDDGTTLNAAYGRRWREYFGHDQVERVCDILSANPHDRRCILGMWDATTDLGSDSLDVPCNLLIMCRVLDGALDFTITNRSNDLVFGLCGANAVHMSILQEYMARRIGVAVGRWYQLSNNLHVYEQHFPLMESIDEAKDHFYPTNSALVSNWWDFDQDCTELCLGRDIGFREPFFNATVAPMLSSWKSWKAGDYRHAVEMACQIEAGDWNIAANLWLKRAQEKRNELTR
jgi:thymidylate synthase